MTEMMIIKEFRGFSNCSVSLCKEDSIAFVRKSTIDISYIGRLRKQMEKQKIAARYFEVPKVYSFEGSESSFLFDMEYIKGQILIKFIEDCNDYSQIIESLDILVSYISKCSEIILEDRNKHFYDIMKRKLSGLVKDSSISKKTMLRLAEYISVFENMDIKETFCHGDLTFENIIHSEKKLICIDLLDSFFSHYWMDIAKIYQDIEGGWYNIKYPELKINQEKMLFIKQYLDKKIHDLDPNYFRHHYFFLTLTFLRILPYCTDKKIEKEILSKVELFAGKLP